MLGSSGFQFWLHPHQPCALGKMHNVAIPCASFGKWDSKTSHHFVLGVERGPEAQGLRRAPAWWWCPLPPPPEHASGQSVSCVAHELPSSRGSRPLPLAGPFQSPCVLASWTSCVRTTSSASSSPWCVTASSSVGMAPTRTRSSQDAVSRGRWRDSGGGPPWAHVSIQFSGLH